MKPLEPRGNRDQHTCYTVYTASYSSTNQGRRVEARVHTTHRKVGFAAVLPTHGTSYQMNRGQNDMSRLFSSTRKKYFLLVGGGEKSKENGVTMMLDYVIFCDFKLPLFKQCTLAVYFCICRPNCELTWCHLIKICVITISLRYSPSDCHCRFNLKLGRWC